MKNHLTHIIQYNLWANQKMVEMLSKNEEELITQNVISSFTSIKETLVHIWQVELIWLYRLDNKSFEKQLMSLGSSSVKEDYQYLIEWSKNWVSYLENLSEKKLSEYREYRTMDGSIYKDQVLKIIHHCMNHSTYHRGQIITLAKQVGIKNIASTDFLKFEF